MVIQPRLDRSVNPVNCRRNQGAIETGQNQALVANPIQPLTTVARR